jgi:hypothetical protein
LLEEMVSENFGIASNISKAPTRLLSKIRHIVFKEGDKGRNGTGLDNNTCAIR